MELVYRASMQSRSLPSLVIPVRTIVGPPRIPCDNIQSLASHDAAAMSPQLHSPAGIQCLPDTQQQPVRVCGPQQMVADQA